MQEFGSVAPINHISIYEMSGTIGEAVAVVGRRRDYKKRLEQKLRRQKHRNQ